MSHIQYNKPEPHDEVDDVEDRSELVDQILTNRHADRDADNAEAPAGAITNMETQNQETVVDRDETDPHSE